VKQGVFLVYTYGDNSAESIKKVIRSYYDFLSNRNYSTLHDFYAPVLERYYAEFNITSDAAIKNAQVYWNKYKIISAQSLIDWNTFEVKSLSDGCFSATFNMDYLIERSENNKAKKFNLDINILFSSDLKIKSIYENIVSSNK